MRKIESIHKEIEKFVKILAKEIDPLEVNNIFHNTLFLSQDPMDKADSTIVSSYILVHQLIFYHVLTISTSKISAFPTLEEILKEKNYKEKIKIEFRNAKKSNEIFQKVFEYDVISTIQNTKYETVYQICQYLLSISNDLIKGDVLGKVFHKMIPFTLRKHVASYFTLDLAAKILANLVITDPSQVVIDPACGSATLLIEAYEAKKKHKMIKGNFDQSDHFRFLEEEIYGLDIMPFSLYLATLNLIMKDITDLPKKINLYLSDSNFLFQTTKVPNETNEIIGSKEFDVVIMNPPFTKKQLMKHASNPNSLTKEYRDILKNIYENEYASGLLNNKSPLYAYFLLIADRLLETKNQKAATNEKYIAAVLPIVFLQNENEKRLRYYLKSKYLWKYIILNEITGNFSEDTQLSEILLVLQKRTSKDDLNSSSLEKIQYILLKTLDETKIDDIIRSIKNPAIFENQCITKAFIEAGSIDFDNLFYPVSLGSMNIDYVREWAHIRRSGAFLSLGSLPNISVESKNSPEPRMCKMNFKEMMFVEKPFKKNSSDPEIIEIDSHTLKIQFKDRTNVKVKRVNLKPALKYPSKVSQSDISNINQFVLYNIDDGFDLKQENVNWEIWKKYLDGRTANLAMIDRVNYIRPGVSLFAFYTSVPRVISRNLAAIKGLNDLYSKCISLWINSSFGILEWISTSVPQQLSFCQHHKNTIMNIKVLNPSILHIHEINEMETIFNQLAKIQFPSLVDQFLALVSHEFKKKNQERLHQIGKFELASTGFGPRILLDTFILNIMLNHCKDQTLNIFNPNNKKKDEILFKTYERIAWLLLTISIHNSTSSGENVNGFESIDIAKI